MVGHHLRHHVEEASIERDERTEGRVHLISDNITAMANQFSQLPEIDSYRANLTDDVRERSFDVMIIAVAGVVAERLLLGARAASKARMKSKPHCTQTFSSGLRAVGARSA